MKLFAYKDKEQFAELDLKPGGSYTVGRKENCDIQLDKLPGISRQHFELVEEGPGAWRVNVLSAIKLIQINGEDRKDFVIEGNGQFSLPPYTFKFEGGENHSLSDDDDSFDQDSDFSNQEDNAMAVQSQEPSLPDDQDVDEEADTFGGNDEKTSIHSFSGLPYIKIIGQNGKKSEYFRLEGNLWVVGGHESASVYIKEPSAAQSHFEISKTDKGFFVVDLGSQQGTELNGQKLKAKKQSRLLSGDIITIGQTSLQFELRDKAFKRKVNNIPLNMYKNPLVFFDQNVAMVSLDDEDSGDGSAQEIYEKKPVDKEKKKKMIMIAAAMIILFSAVAKEFLLAPGDNSQQAKSSDPFTQLSPAEQKIVKQTYKLANQLYLNKNYELALVQIEKLHSIIPVYKKSREMEEYCINARDVQRQRALIEQQRAEQAALEAKVNSYISQCEAQFSDSEDIDGAKACLVPASDLDPNNPRIAQLITEVTARKEEREVREKMAQEQRDKVRRGEELYERARNLHKKQNWLKAIEAYENHIHSGLPDPSRLVKKSKRKLSSIEYQINSKKKALMDQAQTQYNQKNLREAIKKARKAQIVDPYDPKISAFLFQAEKELKNKMKLIYMDSVIEERFSNLEASRVKWEEILKKDIEDGEYYIKARRKMKQYGFPY